MPMKNCLGLEEFIRAIGELQKQFFKGRLRLAQARVAINELLKEAIADDPQCSDSFGKIAAQVVSEMVQEQVKRGRGI